MLFYMLFYSPSIGEIPGMLQNFVVCIKFSEKPIRAEESQYRPNLNIQS